ncbi:MAG: flagellar hook-basal body complex protein FliE [Myxococcales bacterium]|nr:flagellar hook-basal body complex protein FliE [Myxococcales bacterium]
MPLPIQPAPLPLARPNTRPVAVPSEQPATSFAERLSEVVQSADGALKSADVASADFAQGRSNDIHGTMIAMQRADVSLRLVTNIRNRVLEAYREVMRMGG